MTGVSAQIVWQGYAAAGLLQSTSLVGRLARTGLIPQDSAETALGSLFVFDAGEVTEIYRGRRGLSHGFRVLGELLQGHEWQQHRDAVRYALEVGRVVELLMREQTMLAQIRSRLGEIAARGGEDLLGVPWLAGALSTLYQDTLSTLPHRIRVTGDARHLQHEGNADRIRALLLAAVRSGMLWRQVGGRPWKLLLRRGALLELTEQYFERH